MLIDRVIFAIIYTATSFWVAKICALRKKKVFFILDKTKPRNHIELS